MNGAELAAFVIAANATPPSAVKRIDDVFARYTSEH